MSTDQRLESIKDWLSAELGINNCRLEVASADASFRRYFRLISNSDSGVIMDAPPEKEDCLSFVKVAKLIEDAGVQAPHIYNFNEKQGFMRLSDLGSVSYLDDLSVGASDRENIANRLYEDAIQAIVKMQSIKADLPAYDAELLHTEMNLFKDWYLNRHLNMQLDNRQSKVIENTFNLLTDSALEQASVFVHRDYHSRNLMVTSKNNPGVIDFQDAVNGPVSYDLVSLIKDCYIAWPREKQLQWIDQYLMLSGLNLDKQVFIRQFDLMGMQRHLKATGIFARLHHRDNKPGYMMDIPRTLAYVFDVCERYEVFGDFKQMLLDSGLQADAELLKKIQ
ncbi:Phosphotransferase involved in threonylcarbamoyladenosine t(6)A37 formation in tRNA [hydrothermal vent metagenome]|uniref:Phosphotransferase involved in threonylcarbamoyladenosine t(6)A37 formation in tRNA n=1 Tax=hydrothermal vent metagenome TaxID=652676 RepID=A0A3B0XRR7_9ZZZZ